MQSLKDLDLKFKYRSDRDTIYKDFYQKCLNCSVRYDRAVGYFTSDSLRLISRGLESFIDNNGQIRIVANPHLTREDIEAIEKGYKAKSDVIAAALLNAIDVTAKALEDETLNVLAWLIYKNILKIKIAYSKKGYIYHEKFGIFYDHLGNKVVFSGSSNETVGGLVNNFEKIDVYFEEYEKQRIEDAVKDFDNLWDDSTEGLEVVDIPKAVREKILTYKKDSINISRKAPKKVEPREYQLKALKNFRENDWKGILEMATGTGKTITSLVIANKYQQENGRIFLIILVPFTHLVEQWEENCEIFGYKNVLKCFDSKRSWVSKLENRVRDFNIGISTVEVVISTYKTASSPEFNDIISTIRGKSFIIGDECHYFGIKSLRNNKFDNISAKLGLSATPDRWWDEGGTSYLRDFFGDTVYEYSLEEAIKLGVLTEYSYTPVLSGLTMDELKEYEKLTKRIIQLLSKKNKNDEEDMEDLNRKRSLILSKAVQKVDILIGMFREKSISETSHTLIYCAPGQIDDITTRISDLGFRVHKFNSDVDLKDRGKILKAFESGQIQVLVAIKCLDEGVDVPDTKTAYFLASTSNPREFVQRRGRILRKAPSKNIAEIYDFIVLPQNASEATFTSIVSKEMPRFAEFSRYSINEYAAREEIRKYLKIYDLEHLMDKLPWEVYKEMKEKWSDDNGY